MSDSPLVDNDIEEIGARLSQRDNNLEDPMGNAMEVMDQLENSFGKVGSDETEPSTPEAPATPEARPSMPEPTSPEPTSPEARPSTPEARPSTPEPTSPEATTGGFGGALSNYMGGISI